MFIVRRRSNLTQNSVTRFFENLPDALLYIRVIKDSDIDDRILLTSEKINKIAIYTEEKATEIWRFKK